MSEKTNWLLRPRVFLGLLIFAVIVVFLVGYHNHQMKQQRKMATSSVGRSRGTSYPAKSVNHNVLSALPVIKVSIAGHTFKLWLASTAAEKDAGLMHVKKLAADRGMIFLFHTPKPKTFWMKNTPVPLDLIFLYATKVKRIYTMKPMQTKVLYPSKQPVTAAIELKAGTCAKLGLKPGDRIKLPVSAG